MFYHYNFTVSKCLFTVCTAKTNLSNTSMLMLRFRLLNIVKSIKYAMLNRIYQKSGCVQYIWSKNTPLHINAELVSSFKFGHSYLREPLLDDKHHGTSKEGTKAAVLYFLRVLRKANLSQHLVSFYRCSIERVLTHDMCGGSSAADKKAYRES